MQLRLPELKKSNPEAKELKSKDLSESWKDEKSVLQHQSFRYIPEIICFKVISYSNNNILAKHSEIEETRELPIRKYFSSIF